MARLRTRLVLLAFAVAAVACGGRPNADGSPAEPLVTQHAAMVLNYPHDEHEFGELPPDLTPVPGATAQIERHTDRVAGRVDTRITPGHVAKLLAVVLNNPDACEIATPATACGPHEEEFNRVADGGFYLGSGAVAGPDGRVRLTVTARVNDTSNVLCRGAANPAFDPCTLGFSLTNPLGAEVTLVVLDNGPAADDAAVRSQQIASPSPCPTCPPFTAQIAIGFGRDTDQRR